MNGDTKGHFGNELGVRATPEKEPAVRLTAVTGDELTRVEGGAVDAFIWFDAAGYDHSPRTEGLR